MFLCEYVFLNSYLYTCVFSFVSLCECVSTCVFICVRPLVLTCVLMVDKYI